MGIFMFHIERRSGAGTGAMKLIIFVFTDRLTPFLDAPSRLVRLRTKLDDSALPWSKEDLKRETSLPFISQIS